MKPNFKALLTAMGSILMLWGCKETEELSPNPITSGEPVAAIIQTSIGSQSRVHDSFWDENDAIGLAMLVDDGTEIINEVYNYHYVTPAADGVFTPSTGAMTVYFPQDGSNVTFRAYYPYYAAMTDDMLIPVTTADQANLPDIDLLSADHMAGYSKADPRVLLTFHHRLSKLIFKLALQEGGDFVSLDDCTFTIKGMRTEGEYHLIEETLETYPDSEQDIIVPIRGNAAELTGIVMPRAAGEGVTFEITTPRGGKYTAIMNSNLALNAGYQYTFYITLQQTPVEVSATIEEWMDGPESHYDALQVSEAAGANSGVTAGDQMRVYLRDDSDAYNHVKTFTYGADGKWATDTPLWWEDIEPDPAHFRASITAELPLNPTQLADILIAEDLTLQRNKAANFTFNHAASKAFVSVTSDTFSARQLEQARLVLPGYLTGGYEKDGSFVPGTTRADITVDRTDPAASLALFQPQQVSAGGVIAVATIEGRDYTAYAGDSGFTFEAGVAYKLVLNIEKGEVSLSVRVVDWIPGPTTTFDTLVVGATLAGDSEGVSAGDVMKVYLNNGGTYNPLTSYTYNADGTWTTGTPVYWEDIEADPAQLRASIIAAPAINQTQVEDVLIADDLSVSPYTGGNFVFRHAAAKVLVTLRSDTFSDAELESAKIMLPNYYTGGMEQNGRFVNGTTRADVEVDRSDLKAGVALIQPQTVNASAGVIAVTIGGKRYTASAGSSGLRFEAGVATSLVVTINKTGASFSAKVVDWTTTSIDLDAINIIASVEDTDGVLNNEVMTLFTGNATSRNELASYTYNATTGKWSGKDIYWEDLEDPTTFYAWILRQVKYNDSQLDDYLIATPLSAGFNEGINLELSHAAARVVVRLTSTDGSISTTDLAKMSIVLPSYTSGGTYLDGVFTPGTGTGDITVAKNVGQNSDSAIAHIQPQTRPAGSTIVRLTDTVTGQIYNATYTDPVIFRDGVSTVLNIDLAKTGVALSANVIDWRDGNTLNLIPSKIEIGGTKGTTDNFFENKNISVYMIDNQYRAMTYSYKPSVSGAGYEWSGPALYWDDYNNQTLNLAAAYYPLQSQNPSVGAAGTFSWELPANQSTGYDDYDLLLSRAGANFATYVNFTFNHAMSMVRVELSSDEFTLGQLQAASITLNNFRLNGTANLANATVTAAGSATDITPYVETAGVKYSALVMPYKYSQGDQLVTVQMGTGTVPVYGYLDQDITFEAGKTTVIKLKLSRTAVVMTATVQDWEPGDEGTITID